MNNITSPIGVAVWPKLLQPDAFNNEGPRSYSTKLKLNMKEESTVKFLHQLEEAHAEGKDVLNGWRKERKEKALTATQFKKLSNLPWKAEEDDDGKETGFVIVNCKLKEFRKVRGEDTPQRPSLWDHELEPWDLDTPVWSGSEIAVAVEPIPWFTALLGYGITLRLRGVQIHKVVNSTNTADTGEDLGFKAAQKNAAPEGQEESAFGADDF